MSESEREPTVLVLGAAGQVGREMTAAHFPGVRVRGLGRGELDVTRPADVRRSVDGGVHDVVVNLAAWTDVDGAEAHPEEAFRVNRDGAGNVAAACAAAGLPLIHVSTDYVFAGDAASPYAESEPTGPVNVYGESKLAGERCVLDEHPEAIIVRTSAVYGAHGSNFVRTILAAAADREELKVVCDQRTSPTAAPHLASMLMSLAVVLARRPLPSVDGDGPSPPPPGDVLHWTDIGDVSWFELAGEAVEAVRGRLPLRVERIRPTTTEQYGAPAERPRYTVLDGSKAEDLGFTRRPWREGVQRVVREIAQRGR